jgi:hypothetical protein
VIAINNISTQEKLEFSSFKSFFHWALKLPADQFRMYILHEDRSLSPLSESVLRANRNKDLVLVSKVGFVPQYEIKVK